MPKQFFIVKEIPKDEYLRLAKEAGKQERQDWLDASSAGCMQINDKEYLAYTEEEELTVVVGEEEDDY